MGLRTASEDAIQRYLGPMNLHAAPSPALFLLASLAPAAPNSITPTTWTALRFRCASGVTTTASFAIAQVRILLVHIGIHSECDDRYYIAHAR